MTVDSRRSKGRQARTTVLPVRGTALLLIDVVNDLAFDGSESLISEAEPMSKRLADFKRRATRAGIPAVYVNDNFGQWRSDFRRTVAHCTSQSSPGRLVSKRLRPTSKDYFVLKPKHSGILRHDAGHAALRSRDHAGHRHRHRRQYLCAVHRQRRLHARTAHLCAGGLHRVQHGRRQRARAPPDPDCAEGTHRSVRPIHLRAAPWMKMST